MRVFSPLQSTAKDKEESDNVRVAVRCRPLNPDEVSAGRQVVVKVDQLRGQVHLQVSEHAHSQLSLRSGVPDPQRRHGLL